MLFLGNNSNNGLNGNNNLNNNGRFVEIALAQVRTALMRNLWEVLCSEENLYFAFKKARKHKTLKTYVIKFERNLKENLLLLRRELLQKAYRPLPLERFIIRDPKTRKISKSDFRDRIIHHTLCNIIEPIFEKCFIHDSYANRKGKGTLNAIKRFEFFKRKASKNNSRAAFVFKADISRYFDTVNHKLLLQAIKKRIKDKNILWLIKIILGNYSVCNSAKGMPLGNLTSQFFANVFRNEVDKFVKHKLRAKFYIRYVDDFVILHEDKYVLNSYKSKIEKFLRNELGLKLHPSKSRIMPLRKGVDFLGFRNFYYYKLLRKANLRKAKRKLRLFKESFDNKLITYDEIYESMRGWVSYARQANTFRLRQNFSKQIESKFPNEISTIEFNRWAKAITKNNPKPL